MEGVNLIKIYCKYICKSHSVSSLYNYYVLIKTVEFFLHFFFGGTRA
jgi:hypothetical protein